MDEKIEHHAESAETRSGRESDFPDEITLKRVRLEEVENNSDREYIMITPYGYMKWSGDLFQSGWYRPGCGVPIYALPSIDDDESEE